MSSWRWFSGDGGDAWCILADLDVSWLAIYVCDSGGATQMQPAVSEQIVRHLKIYRRFRHLRVVVLRYREVSRSVYHTVVGDLKANTIREISNRFHVTSYLLSLFDWSQQLRNVSKSNANKLRLIHSTRGIFVRLYLCVSFYPPFIANSRRKI